MQKIWHVRYENIYICNDKQKSQMLFCGKLCRCSNDYALRAVRYEVNEFVRERHHLCNYKMITRVKTCYVIQLIGSTTLFGRVLLVGSANSRVCETTNGTSSVSYI